MSLFSLDEYSAKAQQGDAARFEINSAGTGLHRKGMSRGGKVVEWMRDAVGARKAKNRGLTDDFVDAVRAKHGDLIGGQVGNMLQGHRSKPLGSRQIQELKNHADALRTGMRRRN